MGTRATVSKRVIWAGIVLVVLTGLLNFHIPHFLIETPKDSGSSAYLLELVVLANLLGALVAAVGIYRNVRWGWLLGLLVAGISVLLYVAQETVGLPGLPKMWLDPSRILALIVEGMFVVLARFQGISSVREGADVFRSTSLS